MNHFLKRIALVGIALCMASGTVVAQLAPNPTAAPKLLSDTEVKAKYQNCEGGWYSGPRPGKARYAKDPFLWVVTPEFAKRFCMPPEFVSTDLKGQRPWLFALSKNLMTSTVVLVGTQKRVLSRWHFALRCISSVT